MLNSGYILDEKYEVVKTLGQGGMSTVYLCKNLRLGNLWAIKEVKKELKGQIDFLAEPNILKNLSHPGIPRVVDIFYREDNLYIVEDYIEGETLQDYIKRNGFIGMSGISKIVLDICDIIEYLHSFNPPIIYRDLKPSNVMINPKEKVVLIDFGISRVYKQGEDKDTICMGSKGYAAPEQYGIEQTCIQTDIYGIGAVMYFMITGKASTALLEPLRDENYGNEVNIQFKKIIQKSMQIDIQSRHSSVNEIKKELIGFLEKKYETKTLLTKNSEEYSKTLLINNKSFEFNDYINNKIFRSTGSKNTDNDKNKLKNFSETDKQRIHNEENNIEDKDTLDRGTINFYRVNSNGDKTEVGDSTVKISDEKININNSDKEDNKKVNNQKSIKSDKQFKTPYSNSKINKDKSKKSIKRKLLSILVCIAVILGLVYFFTDYGENQQIINSKNHNSAESVSDISKPEKESNTNNADVNKEDVKSSTQPAENKPSSEKSSTNESTIDKGASTNISDKTLENKKESKTKNNGKAKGKHKYDESN